MKNDPIVDDVQQTRERLAAKFNYNVAAIFADMRSRETSSGTRLKNRQSSPNEAVRPNGNTMSTGMENTTPAER